MSCWIVRQFGVADAQRAVGGERGDHSDAAALFWRCKGWRSCWRRCTWSSRRMNPGLKVAGIVLTMFDSQTKLAAEVVNDLNSFIESAKGKALPWANRGFSGARSGGTSSWRSSLALGRRF